MKSDDTTKMPGRKWNSIDDLVPEFDFAGTGKRIRGISSSQREEINAVLTSLSPDLARIAYEHHDVSITPVESIKKAGSSIGKNVDFPVVCLRVLPGADQTTTTKLEKLMAFLVSVGYTADHRNDRGDDPGQYFGLYSHIIG